MGCWFAGGWAEGIVFGGLHRLLAIVLALLFLYKAFEEHVFDALWSLIYLLVGVEYMLEAVQWRRRGGGSE